MAGVGAVIEGWDDGRWYLCPDGMFMDTIDIVGLLFPNKGRNATQYNQCFVPRHLTFSPLRALLPDPTGHFVPDDLVDSIVALTILCVLVTVGLILCKLAWEKVDPCFAAISPPHKKWYVVANFSKVFFLGVMAVGRRFWIAFYLRFFLDEFDTLTMKRFGMTYAVTDLVALYMVPKLPQSTVLHHVTTVLLCLLISAMDLTVKGWGGLLGMTKMIVFYGMCSTVAYPVNAYLALRVVYPKAKWLTGLVKLSMWTYVVCCAVNWTAHGLWLVGLVINMDISAAPLLYLVPVAVMINDDIVLMKWLIKRSAPMAAESLKKE